MDDVHFKKLYKKYIDRNFYHVFPKSHLDSLNNQNIDPKKDPYEHNKKKIVRLFNLLLRLEKKGFGHTQDWGFKIVDGKYIVKISLIDLHSKLLDFTPEYKETYFYKNHKGGALVTCLNNITTDILSRKPKLKSPEINLVEEIHDWTTKQMKTKMITMVINGKNKLFESAKFQAIHFDKEYWQSPFGVFENFKKITTKKDFDKYLPFLTNKKKFYLRVTDKITKKDIIKLI